MLTARGKLADRVNGLDVGADDYLVKPFTLEELSARLRALDRRASLERPQITDGTLPSGGLTLNLTSREVARDGRQLTLTKTEFDLLELLLSHPRQRLSRSTIMERLWGYGFRPSSNSLEVFVSYLRHKLEAGGEPWLLHTVRGVDYTLRESPS